MHCFGFGGGGTLAARMLSHAQHIKPLKNQLTAQMVAIHFAWLPVRLWSEMLAKAINPITTPTSNHQTIQWGTRYAADRFKNGRSLTALTLVPLL
jgi:hypothetical protein